MVRSRERSVDSSWRLCWCRLLIASLLLWLLLLLLLLLVVVVVVLEVSVWLDVSWCL